MIDRADYEDYRWTISPKFEQLLGLFAFRYRERPLMLAHKDFFCGHLPLPIKIICLNKNDFSGELSGQFSRGSK